MSERPTRLASYSDCILTTFLDKSLRVQISWALTPGLFLHSIPLLRTGDAMLTATGRIFWPSESLLVESDAVRGLNRDPEFCPQWTAVLPPGTIDTLLGLSECWSGKDRFVCGPPYYRNRTWPTGNSSIRIRLQV